jgi:hypothetical protein
VFVIILALVIIPVTGILAIIIRIAILGVVIIVRPAAGAAAIRSAVVV